MALLFILLLGFLKLILYLVLLFICFIIGLKLWLEPIKGVCKCKTKLQGKVALITGGNSGIGLETARDLAKRGARVIIACRNTTKSKEAIADIIKSTGNTNVEYRHLDLSKFSSIRKFADDFNETIDRLDILVNNAGCAGVKQKPSEDGIDLVMQINYLGPFLLTNLLLDKLKASKPSRIVIVSSYAHNLAKFDPEDLVGLNSKGTMTKYSNSKLCNVLWTKALSKRLPERVTVNALHPGVVKTNIFSKLSPWLKTVIYAVINMVFKSPEEGAQTTIHLSVAPEIQNSTGGYYANCKLSNTSDLVKNDYLVEKVYKKSLYLTGAVEK